MKKYTPQDVTIAITYKCNSRCRMCNIWQMENPTDLPIGYFYNLSSSIRYINLSGGEPFLRQDLPEIVKIIKQVSPRAQIIFSSNGFATELIIKSIQEILKIDKGIGVRISLDGLEKTHNQIRGIPDIFSRAMATIRLLKEVGVKNLGISFTIMDLNVRELISVYNLSRKLDLQLATALVQNSDIYFRKHDNVVRQIDEVTRGLNYVIKQELKSWDIKRWLRAYYNFGLLRYAQKRERLLPSGAGFDSLFIDPFGDIYPSNLIDMKMGNIGKQKLDQIWSSKEAENVRQEIKNKNITESWIICTIRGALKRNFLKLGWWILKNKLKNMV